MGLVLADALAERGSEVRLWCRRPEFARELEASRQSPLLPGFTLAPEVEVVSDDHVALDGASVILCAVPTQHIRSVFTRLRWDARKDAIVISVSKGIEVETLLCPTQIIAQMLGDMTSYPSHPMCVLSGPAIAMELAERLPATLVAASIDEVIAERVQDLFAVPWLRIYRKTDLLGVEIAGATKNVIAIAAGIVDGLGIGLNAKSALLARGLSEIARLGTAMGAKLDTFFGIAGVGDLATTCFSPHGRNRSCGERLGKGESIDDVLGSSEFVVEGVPTTKSMMTLASVHNVEMPITAAVNAILFEGLSPKKAIDSLMQREPKPERIG